MPPHSKSEASSQSVPELPSAEQRTRWRRLLDDIISGTEPVPGYVAKMALPRLREWRVGAVFGTLQLPDDFTVAPGVGFGGYSAAALDQFAGFVMFSLMPHDTRLLTSRIEVEFRRPLAAGAASISGSLVGWTDARTALVEVLITQHGSTTAVGRAVQVLKGLEAAATRGQVEQDDPAPAKEG